jgi:hypothetical protein
VLSGLSQSRLVRSNQLYELDVKRSGDADNSLERCSAAALLKLADVAASDVGCFSYLLLRHATSSTEFVNRDCKRAAFSGQRFWHVGTMSMLSRACQRLRR